MDDFPIWMKLLVWLIIGGTVANMEEIVNPFRDLAIVVFVVVVAVVLFIWLTQ